MNRLLCLLIIALCSSLVYTQGFPTMPGVIDLKEPDINLSNVRHFLNNSVIELKEPDSPPVEEKIIEDIDKKITEAEEVGPIIGVEEKIIEVGEVGPVIPVVEKVIEVEEVEPLERGEVEPSEREELTTEVIPVNPEEHVIFYIPDFGDEREEDVVDSDNPEHEHEIIELNDLEGVEPKDDGEPRIVNPHEYEVVDHPHLSDATDVDDNVKSLANDVNLEHEHEIIEMNDLEKSEPKDDDEPRIVNHLEYEVVDHPHLSDDDEFKFDVLDLRGDN